MKNHTDKYGLTLLEILVAAAIIAVLVFITINVARRIDNQSKERLAEDTIAIIKAALGQFEDYKYNYSDPNYRTFVFPLDCNGFNVAAAEIVLSAALGAAVTMTPDPCTGFTGCEVMYFLLSQVPECRTTLDRIDKSLITNKGSNNQDMNVTVGSNTYLLIRVVDPWGMTLRYDYYDETALSIDDMRDSRRTFPVVISAGPDKNFGTIDDITSK